MGRKTDRDLSVGRKRRESIDCDGEKSRAQVGGVLVFLVLLLGDHTVLHESIGMAGATKVPIEQFGGLRHVFLVGGA